MSREVEERKEFLEEMEKIGGSAARRRYEAMLTGEMADKIKEMEDCIRRIK